MARHLWIGRVGEWTALAWLLVKGYRLRHRNWRGGGGELDLVMERRRVVVFVEVKTRRSPDFGGAAAAVGWRKQCTLARTAAAYLSGSELWDRPYRFDVVAIEGGGSGPFGWRLRHHVNAFAPDLGRPL